MNCEQRSENIFTVIKDLFRDLLIEVKGFKYQVTLKV